MKFATREIIIAAAAILLSTNAMAEIFTCKKKGETVYSDAPCGANAEAYTPQTPIIITPSESLTDLEKEYNQRQQKLNKSSEKANKAWLEDYERRREQENRVRAGFISRKPVRGMTSAQVRQIMGEPDQIITNNDSVTWMYKSHTDKQYRVRMDAGVVSKVYSRKINKK